MPEPARQLTLGLPVETRLGREDFLVSPSNETAYGAVERFPDWTTSLLVLQGPPGSGKSHLGAIWAERAEARTVAAREVGADRVAGLAGAPALLVEDLDRGPVDEPALFHLVNLLRERGAFLVVSAGRRPEDCGLSTPDLLSRLRLAPRAVIEAPDDSLLRAVLIKLFLDRQLVVDTSVVDFLLTRMERSLASAASLVAQLDEEALSRGRRVTRPIAADILSRTDAVPDTD